MEKECTRIDPYTDIYGYKCNHDLMTIMENKNVKRIEHINQIYTVAFPHCQEIFVKKRSGKCMICK